MKVSRSRRPGVGAQLMVSVAAVHAHTAGHCSWARAGPAVSPRSARQRRRREGAMARRRRGGLFGAGVAKRGAGLPHE